MNETRPSDEEELAAAIAAAQAEADSDSAEVEISAEPTPQPAPQKAPEPPSPEPQTAAQGAPEQTDEIRIPKARLDEVIRRSRQNDLERENEIRRLHADLALARQQVAAQQQPQAQEPAPRTWDDALADRVSLAQQVDAGNMTVAEFVRRDAAIQREMGQMQVAEAAYHVREQVTQQVIQNDAWLAGETVKLRDQNAGWLQNVPAEELKAQFARAEHLARSRGEDVSSPAGIFRLRQQAVRFAFVSMYGQNAIEQQRQQSLAARQQPAQSVPPKSPPVQFKSTAPPPAPPSLAAAPAGIAAPQTTLTTNDILAMDRDRLGEMSDAEWRKLVGISG